MWAFSRNVTLSPERVASPARLRKPNSTQVRLTYLAIHNFFLASPVCPTQRRLLTSTTVDRAYSINTISNSNSKATQSFLTHSLSLASRSNHAAADEEWLQDNISQTEPYLSSSSGVEHPRFDWRLRAPSQIRRSLRSATTKYAKRIEPPRPDFREGSPYYDAVGSYEKRFVKLLDAEQEETRAAVHERLSTWGLDRLKEEGYCLTRLSAYWLQENQFGRHVAAFAIGPGITLPDHKFENGVEVLVSRIDPLLDQQVFKGSVILSESTRLKVAFFDMHPIDTGAWRLDIGHSDIIYRRMCEAISNTRQDPATLEKQSLTDPQVILQGTELRDVILRTFDDSREYHQHVSLQAPDELSYLPHNELDHKGKGPLAKEWMGAFMDDMRIQSWAKRYSKEDPVIVEGDPELPGLNATQRRAVANMVGQRISLVQGPPGTGKTKTIIETVKLLKIDFEVPHPLLVCTFTNVAVDNLVEGLVARGVKALRVGSSGGSVRESLLEYTLDHRLEQHPSAKTLRYLVNSKDKLSVEIDDLRDRLAKSVEKEQSKRAEEKRNNMMRDLIKMEESMRNLKGRMYAIKQKMLKDVVWGADVICTTCITSACLALKVIDFPVVFLDEASMSTEPASLIPIMKGSRHLALIGDHKQLPPVITSPEAKALGLGLSLFERLTEEGVVPSIMLDIQYRMHPAISRFPSSEFYNHALQDGTIDRNGKVQSRLSPPMSRHLLVDGETGNRPSVIFIDHMSLESMKDRSRANVSEAHIVVSIVEDLLLSNPQLTGHDIGIIAPYVAQISLLVRLLHRDAKYKQRFRDVLGQHRAMQIPNVEVKTVDGFEGREKEVIVFSTVRNNAGGYIGFLADRRRLNVGLTRARRGLFVVGNLTTLQKGRRAVSQPENVDSMGSGADSWRRYAKYLLDEGLVIKLAGDELGHALNGNLHAAQSRKLLLASTS